MKHTFFIVFEINKLFDDKVKDLFKEYKTEVEDNCFYVYFNSEYIEPVELNKRLLILLELIDLKWDSVINNAVNNLTLWLNVYNNGNPFCWTLLSHDIFKLIGTLEVNVEVEFYPIDLTY